MELPDLWGLSPSSNFVILMLQNPDSQHGVGLGMVQMYLHPEILWGLFQLPLPCLGQCFSSDFSLAFHHYSSDQEPSRTARTELKCHLCLKLCGKVTAHQQHDWGVLRWHSGLCQSSSKRVQTGAGLLEIISVSHHSDHISHSSAEEQYKFLSSWFMWPLRFIPSDRSLRFLLFIFFSDSLKTHISAPCYRLLTALFLVGESAINLTLINWQKIAIPETVWAPILHLLL